MARNILIVGLTAVVGTLLVIMITLVFGDAAGYLLEFIYSSCWTLSTMGWILVGIAIVLVIASIYFAFTMWKLIGYVTSGAAGIILGIVLYAALLMASICALPL
jgi:hypothetical protein